MTPTPTFITQRDLYLKVLALLADSANILNQADLCISVLALFRSAFFGPLLQSTLKNSSQSDLSWLISQHVGTFSETANCKPRTQLDLYLNVSALFAVTPTDVEFGEWV